MRRVQQLHIALRRRNRRKAACTSAPAPSANRRRLAALLLVLLLLVALGRDAAATPADTDAGVAATRAAGGPTDNRKAVSKTRAKATPTTSASARCRRAAAGSRCAAPLLIRVDEITHPGASTGVIRSRTPGVPVLGLVPPITFEEEEKEPTSSRRECSAPLVSLTALSMASPHSRRRCVCLGPLFSLVLSRSSTLVHHV